VVSSLRIATADLTDSAHQAEIVALIDAYARDVMGMGRPLEDEVKRRLIPGLRAHPTTLAFLAYLEDRAVGIALCFRGFSSFRALPLINLHDLAVLPEARGQGVGRALLEAVAAHGRAIGCCKLTLETQEHNETAQRLYRSAGFEGGHVPGAGGVIFMTKAL
jgi:ribosomal protein S18 acetylase RimI-like enzyme